MIRPPRKLVATDPEWREFVQWANDLVACLESIWHDRSQNSITTRGTSRIETPPQDQAGTDGDNNGDARWQ